MNDRELLESAAKAAYYNYDADSQTLQVHKYHAWQFGWNPLASDGDEFRLAVDLKLSIAFWDDGRVAAVHKDVSLFDSMESYQEDKHAATRRDITRAAAAIGAAK